MHVSRGNLIYIKKRSHVRLELLQTSSPICGAAIAHRGREGIKDHIRKKYLQKGREAAVRLAAFLPEEDFDEDETLPR